MKKTYMKIRTFAALLSLLAFSAGAQMSGVYTINSGLATGGTNFQTFGALSAALTASGVAGPVTVNVVPLSGPYVEQPAFGNIPGVSANNKVTINGNGNLLTFASTNTAPWVMCLNNTRYLNVNNLLMQGTGASYAMVLILTNASDYNTFTACSFSCPANGTNSYQIPVAFSSSSLSPSAGGNPGNNNTLTTCTLSSGYYSIFHYGLSSAPWTRDNSFIGCVIADWYYYGVYAYYAKNLTFRSCDFNRMTRTNLGTFQYFYYGFYSQGSVTDRCTFHDFWNMNQTQTGTLYGFYYLGYGSSNPENRHTFSNNIIRDMKWNGTSYWFYYNYNSNNDYFNNTFSFDHNTTATTYVFYYCYANGSNFNTWKSNLFSLTNTSSGTKYGMYFGGQTTSSVIENNNYHVSGTNCWTGYWTSAAQTFTAWQAQGPDVTGYGLDPQYTNLATGNLMPTNAALNNLANPIGNVWDNSSAVRNPVTPDIGALEFLTPACGSTMALTSVAGPTYALCPGEITTMGISPLNANSGWTYQWQSSTISNVGPWTPVSGGNGNSLFYTTPPVSVNTWWSVVMTCTNPGGTSTTPVTQVLVAGPTVDNVPYYEGFETVGMPNRLPNCSWIASGQGINNNTTPTSMSGNRVPRNGSSLAYFANLPTGTSAYYTNPINMNPGITYSAALWYATEYFGYANWTNLQILVGPNQSATGATVVASVASALSGPYKLLDGLFTVPSSGTYYVGIRATAASGNAQYLSWDDLSVTIPCHEGSPNTPTLTSNASSYTVCEGQNVSLNAAGADTYTWSTGANVPSTSDNPMANSNGYVIYTVWGQNSITGCIATSTMQVYVNPAPPVFVVASPPVVCAGQPVNLSAYGALNYAWSNSSIGQNITVNPTANTSYTVIGTNAFGCSTSYGINITVNALPVINAISSNPGEACKDDALTLTASGGVTYQWLSSTSSAVYQGNPINISSSATTIFTVSGTNANGCVGKTTLIQNINNCTGISKNSGTEGFRVFPNPTAGEFSIEFNNNNDKTVEVTDVTGRMIVSSTTTDSTVNVNIKNLAAGIYYVKVKSNDSTEVVKVVKQ